MTVILWGFLYLKGGLIMVYQGTPNLETERLLLRKFTVEDANDIYEYASDPEVAKYVTWNHHQTINDSLGFIKFTLGNYERGVRL
jgi:[ribosomal protein S5]-alanine N-acetyltransferase